MKKRIASLLLSVALCTSFLIVPVHAVYELPGTVTNTAPSVLGGNVSSLLNLFDRAFEQIGADLTLSCGTYWCDSYWAQNHHVFCTYESLHSYADALNSYYVGKGWSFTVVPLADTPYRCIRMVRNSINSNYFSRNFIVLADPEGNALLASETNGTSSSNKVQVPDIVVAYDTAIDRIRNSRYHLISYDSYLDKLNDPLTIGNSMYYWYTQNDNGLNYLVSRSYRWIRCDPSGIPYVYVDATANTVNNTIRETTEVFNEAGEKLEDAVVNVGSDLTSAITDLASSVDNLTLNLPVGDSEPIADCYYDSFNNCYEYYTYDTTNNTYNSYAFEYYTNYT